MITGEQLIGIVLVIGYIIFREIKFWEHILNLK